LLLQVDWASMGVELMLECSGKFLDRAKLQPFFDRVLKSDMLYALAWAPSLCLQAPCAIARHLP
jgi:hypothetical protein